MFKYILLAALCACVLADGVFRQPDLGCAYRIVVTDEDDHETDYSIRMNNRVPLVLKKQDDSDETTVLVRGDVKVGGQLTQLTKTVDYCEMEYIDLDSVEIPEFEDFEWVDKDTGIGCPDGKSSDCVEYWNEDDESILVDGQGRLIRDVDEVFYTYLDPPSLDVFDEENCEGEDPLPYPTDPCSGTASSSSGSSKPSAIFMPSIDYLGCAFHFVSDNSGEKTEYSVRWNWKDSRALIFEEGPESTTLVRGDMKSGDDVFVLYKNEDDDECEGEYSSLELPDVVKGFAYVGDPIEDEDCPDGLSSDCVKYCADEDEQECILVDIHGRIVQYVDETVITYDSDVPSLDVFQQEPCEGEDPLPYPVDPCIDGSSSSSAVTPSSVPSGSHSSGSSGSRSGSPSSTTSTTSSTQPPTPSSASFVLPSVMLLLIAAVLAL